MSSYLSYDLQDGYIHHWLVGGPQVSVVEDVPDLQDERVRAQVVSRFYEEASGITQQPLEPGPLAGSEFTVGAYTGRWAYYACADDHFVDCSAFYASYHYSRAWAYTRLESPVAQVRLLVLAAYGPASVWLNGELCCRHEDFGFRQVVFEVALVEGDNEILVRFEQAGVRECRHAVALRLDRDRAGMRVRVPTAIQDLTYRNRLEHLFATAYVDRDVFTWDTPVSVHWLGDGEAAEDVTVRLQTLSGRIYAESHAPVLPGSVSHLGYALQAPEGPLRITLMPRLELYYEQNLRIRREFLVQGSGQQRYAETPTGTYAERRIAALTHAARQEGDLFGEVAKMALGEWETLDVGTMLRALALIEHGEDGCELHLLALLGIAGRWSDAGFFPEALRAPLEACAREFRYAGPGESALSESRRIVLYTCELLAGQLYPQLVFAASGQNGAWHCEHALRLALDWLQRRGTGGFADWDSSYAFALELVALAHLLDLAEDPSLWEMATVVLDKLLLSVALNTYCGVPGTQGSARAEALLSGWTSAMAGVARLLWGVGVFNRQLAATVSMACIEDYELPPLIPAIATEEGELWNREQHRMEDNGTVSKVTYRTPDSMLASAQDYRPGEPGGREHIWQATLGPEALVFANHPACSGTSDAHAPGFWLGNAVLPRVAQWKDVLIALYCLPDEDWMGYTHAYFPLYAFDAHALRTSVQGHTWAFAQKGKGYLALCASTGLVLGTQGAGAYRELHARGQCAWLCHMGRSAPDGTFEDFQNRVLALPVTFEGLRVHCTTLRGDTLSFDWAGPLLRNGREQPLSGEWHYENPYCTSDLNAPEMEVKSAHYWMRLKFAQAEPS